MNGKHGDNSSKLADALVKLAGLDDRPARFTAGANAVQAVEIKAGTLLAQADADHVLSSSLNLNDPG